MTLPPNVPFERRSEPRHEVRAAARIWFGAGYALWADCKLRDLSTGGARIELPPGFKLTPRLALVHTAEPTIFEAVVRWQRGAAAGMNFEARHPFDGPVPARLTHIRDTWRALHPSS